MISPFTTLRKMKVASVEEVAAVVTPEFVQLADDYPQEFGRYFGQPDSANFASALTLGKQVYMSEACWHCHSQFVRPVSNESSRYGPVSLASEYQNELNYPPLSGTRRVGPYLSRSAGRHTNDWHAAHFWDSDDGCADICDAAIPMVLR